MKWFRYDTPDHIVENAINPELYMPMYIYITNTFVHIAIYTA